MSHKYKLYIQKYIPRDQSEPQHRNGTKKNQKRTSNAHKKILGPGIKLKPLLGLNISL